MSDARDLSVDGLRILVVGAGSGIGAATVSLLDERGARAVGADIAPGSRVGILADITDPAQCGSVVDRAAEALGGLDGIAVTAGGGRYRAVESTDVDVWSATLALNTVGPALLARAAAPYLLDSPDASFVTVASASGIRSYSEFSAYGTAKAALIHWSRIAAREFAERGLRVNCVSPGPIDTPMLRDTRPAPYSESEWLSEVAKNTAVKRAGTAKEVAEAIVFLLSRRSTFITGAVLPVDGGETA